ncbi:phosphatase PAP2 family protein [Candidatus Roizmanbacteria bacterium]|nr:phosphatase PAP2 family protein [Candidatus Roizmanbacteria bacterium]
MVNLFIAYDRQITQFLNWIIPHNRWLDGFFSFFSLSGSSFFIWILVISIVLIYEELVHPGIQKRDVRFVVYFLVSFLVTFIIANYLLKNIFARSRPDHRLPASTVKNVCPDDYSFPSSHATTAFSASTILAFFDKKRGRFYYAVAGLISLSRIYLFCHYFSDVFFGAILGYLISRLIIKIRMV